MNQLTKKITFIMTNKKITNLLIIVVCTFAFVGTLKYLEIYEGMTPKEPATKNDKKVSKKDAKNKMISNFNIEIGKAQ